MNQHGYYRFPTLNDDTVVFVCEDDLWAVAAGGGGARRLTSNPGQASSPALSPDGQWLAFAGRDEGQPEVYLMPASGGPAERLTYLGADTRVVGWRADGSAILFASNHGQPFMRTYRLYAVAPDGGQPEPLATGPAMSISYGHDGGAVIGRHATDIARWKRYRGGLTGDMWIDARGDGAWRRLIRLAGNVAMPQWVGDRIYFVSDHEGIGNLYSCTTDGADLRRHSHHTDYYARHPATDGRRIVYHAGADLYLFDPSTDAVRPITVDFRSPRAQLKRKFAPAARYLQGFAVHPEGHSVAVVARGQSFTMGNWEGAVVHHGDTEGARQRLVAWLHDGKRLVVTTDGPGEETLEVRHADASAPPQRLEGLDIGRPVAMVASPKAPTVAITNQRMELLLVDVEAGTRRLLDSSRFEGIHGVTWSPDGRWLAYGFSVTRQTSIIRLCDLGTGAIHDATRALLIDTAPAFDPDGKYLYFLSYREFQPVYDSLHFDLSFPRGARPYLITLQADAPSPFVPVPRAPGEKPKPGDDGSGEGDGEGDGKDDGTGDGEGDGQGDGQGDGEGDGEGDGKNDGKGDGKGDGKVGDQDQDQGEGGAGGGALEGAGPRDGGSGGGSEGNDGGKGGGGATSRSADGPGAAASRGGKRASPKPDKPIRIDLDGITDRVLAFPVPEGRYGQVRGIKGQALFTNAPVSSALGESVPGIQPPPRAWLESYRFEDQKSQTLVTEVTSFEVSADGKTLVYRSGQRLRAVKAGEKPDDGDDAPGRKSGWLDLGRLRVSVDPGREWEQMFREAWRLQRDHFWTADMSGVDWQRVYQRYFPLVARLASRSEFSDLMWEMQGELGTSHAYEIGGDYRPEPSYDLGLLGADLAFDAATDSYRVTKIVRGDPWDELRSSPLARAGVDVRPGDRLIAVGGRRVGRDLPPGALLVNQAGTQVLLSFARDGAGGDDGNDGGSEGPRIRSVTVKTLVSERMARYRDWVEANRARVDEATNGRVGYVHIPDMGAGGYAEFHRGFLPGIDREALIVDARYNGGGHVSQLILEKLARKRIGYDVTRWGQPAPYPYESVLGPLVALTNEQAGSDGDMFSHAFKLMALGPLIGTRTWGGVIGIDMSNSLVDGGMTTQPQYSFWFQDVQWGLENHGAVPDIEVEIRPQDDVARQDPQLDRAIAEILSLMAAHPPRVPEFGDRPRLELPELPR